MNSDCKEYKLIDVVDLKSGTTVKKGLELKFGDVAYIKVSGMNLEGNEKRITTSNEYLNHEDINIRNIFPIGTTIFPKRGGAIATNKKRLTEIPLCVDLNTMGAIPKSGLVIPLYVYFYFQSFDLLSISNGTTIPQINNYSFDKLKIFVPPIPEQKRIVSILDTVFADLEQTRAKTEQNLKNARELFDSYLQQVFSQKGEGWVENTLGEITGGVSTGPFGSLLHKSDYIDNGIPLVNPAHIVGQKIVPDSRKTITEETALRLSAYKMKAGDIVIGRRGDMGRCALITQAEDGYLCGTGSFIIKSSDRFDGGFLVRFLRSASCVARLENIAGGAVMPNLSNSSLSNFRIYMPSKTKQIEITSLINNISIEIEKIIDIYNKKLNAIDELKKSILQKTFSGELTKTVEHSRSHAPRGNA
ncbi:hypothetical protein A8139_03695 [Marinomonas primoryensis]|uniref:Type I restriction modification DNA specificity domain-containing protein n=1 Tax=Marinomonas primoryensis TaxID=178399 RepID=A0A2Z4PP38_9GAMM|nr:restriction endonuclease subunit S [Marinomonas primoryensis]AWX99204.1 hypothetical protein A8139_03695 [Marinomonas primoryensis]